MCGGGLDPLVQEVGCVRHCVAVLALFVDFQNFLENGRQDSAVVGAPPFRPSFQSIENIKCTLPALAATPLQRCMRMFGYLLDVFMW